MRAKNYKGSKCTTRKLKKCEEIAKTYDKIQTALSLILDRDENIESIMCTRISMFEYPDVDVIC